VAVGGGPERIGDRYRLVQELGAGGFGRVWKAHDETLGVDVAIKEVRLPLTVSDAERSQFLARARREARNAARLRDQPGIIPVHDVVIRDEVPWIVMRLVDGHSLEDRLKKDGPIPAEETTRIAKALLKALDAAHSAGVVHRDIKPANVMLTRTGEVLLADFGIAVHQADTAMTATGAIIGSLEYLAPERLRGKNNGPAGDLFSLGSPCTAASRACRRSAGKHRPR
jgi:serine/threonine protein kinase